MRKIGIMLIALVAFMVIGCQPPEGMGGVSQEQFDELKAQVEMMKTDMEYMQTAMDSLMAAYNTHIEKFHKGGTIVKPPEPTPPPRKGAK
jgi:ABC-type transporter MlaC component